MNENITKPKANRPKRLSKEILIGRIQEFHKIEGKVPTFKDFKFASIYPRYFGNWTNALKAAGLERTLEAKDKPQSNSQERQNQRGTEIKLELIQALGGRCCKCGYCKNSAALQFHHLDQNLKTMSLDRRSLANMSKTRIDKEIENCCLICANCHIELHNPQHNL